MRSAKTFSRRSSSTASGRSAHPLPGQPPERDPDRHEPEPPRRHPALRPRHEPLPVPGLVRRQPRHRGAARGLDRILGRGRGADGPRQARRGLPPGGLDAHGRHRLSGPGRLVVGERSARPVRRLPRLPVLPLQPGRLLLPAHRRAGLPRAARPAAGLRPRLGGGGTPPGGRRAASRRGGELVRGEAPVDRPGRHDERRDRLGPAGLGRVHRPVRRHLRPLPARPDGRGAHRGPGRTLRGALREVAVPHDRRRDDGPHPRAGLGRGHLVLHRRRGLLGVLRNAGPRRDVEELHAALRGRRHGGHAPGDRRHGVPLRRRRARRVDAPVAAGAGRVLRARGRTRDRAGTRSRERGPVDPLRVRPPGRRRHLHAPRADDLRPPHPAGRPGARRPDPPRGSRPSPRAT